MSASEQLYALAGRAKHVEEHLDAAKAKGEADLKSQVDKARDASQQRAADMKAAADRAETKTSSWWGDVQRNWDDHIAKVRQNVQDKKDEHDAKTAERRADDAEADAEAAVDFAYAALEEAEYAVLDAELARMEANDAAATR